MAVAWLCHGDVMPASLPDCPSSLPPVHLLAHLLVLHFADRSNLSSVNPLSAFPSPLTFSLALPPIHPPSLPPARTPMLPPARLPARLSARLPSRLPARLPAHVPCTSYCSLRLLQYIMHRTHGNVSKLVDVSPLNLISNVPGSTSNRTNTIYINLNQIRLQAPNLANFSPKHCQPLRIL